MTKGIEGVRALMESAVDIELPEDLVFAEEEGAGGFDGGTGFGDEEPPRTPEGPDEDLPPEAEGAKFAQNDTGNAERFKLYCGDEAMHVPRMGWHVWDKRRWRLDPDGIAVRRLAQTVYARIDNEIPYLQLNSVERRKVERVEAIRGELREVDTGTDLDADEKADRRRILIAERERLNSELWGRGSSRQRHKSFAQTTGNKGRIDAILGEAVTMLNRQVEDLDADPLTVNTESGILRFKVVDLREEGGSKVASFDLLPHARSVPIEGRSALQYITKMMPVAYDPAAKCPGFDRFLAQVQPDPEMRAFLQRWFGLNMVALPIQKFLYCYGMGANGKSLLAALMRRMLGDYATMVRIESLTGKNRKSGSDATPDLMRLIGARAAITNEPDEGERLQEQKVKEMTGGDEMLVRNLHSDFVAFTPYFKLTFTGNHKLEIRGTDDGIWRRPLLCPFNVQIPEADRDEKLGDKLFENERSGILNWMIDGLVDYLERGLQEPAQVSSATEEYRQDSDPIGDFLGTACVMDGGADFLPARDLTDACYLYLLENTSHAWQPGNLSRKLKDRSGKFLHPQSRKSFTRHKRNGTWGYAGVSLTGEMRTKLSEAPRDVKGLPMARNGASSSYDDHRDD
ncbi:phage/plasmid primase, P4 family [Cereibacter sphaeroides]|nr:phage/plasmid primase, P4 family [Cereibacter sphaeroides]